MEQVKAATAAARDSAASGSGSSQGTAGDQSARHGCKSDRQRDSWTHGCPEQGHNSAHDRARDQQSNRGIGQQAGHFHRHSASCTWRPYQEGAPGHALLAPSYFIGNDEQLRNWNHADSTCRVHTNEQIWRSGL